MAGGVRRRFGGRRSLCTKRHIRQAAWCQESTAFLHTSRKTQIAKYAKGPTFTRAPSRKRTGNQVRRAVKYGGLITAAHEVLNEEGGAITGMPLWYKSWLLSGCNRIRAEPNLLRKRNRVNDSLSSRQARPKVIYRDSSPEFGKACEDLSWDHCASTPHRSETNGIAGWAVRRVKEGTSAVLL